MGGLRGLGGQGFVVVGLRGVGVEGEGELVVPAELEACLAHGVVPVARAGVTLGHVGGVGGEFVGDHAGFHVVTVGKSQVFLRGDVAEHGGAAGGDVGGADG